MVNCQITRGQTVFSFVWEPDTTRENPSSEAFWKLYVYVCMYIYICIYIYIHVIHAYIHTYIYVYIHVHVYTFIYSWVCIYIYMYTHCWGIGTTWSKWNGMGCSQPPSYTRAYPLKGLSFTQKVHNGATFPKSVKKHGFSGGVHIYIYILLVI